MKKHKRLVGVFLVTLVVFFAVVAVFILNKGERSDIANYGMKSSGEAEDSFTSNKENLQETEKTAAETGTTIELGVSAETEKTAEPGGKAETAAEPGAVGTETTAETETEIAELSYIELYGLEEVDKPEKRTTEQVIQKLEELSERYELVREVYGNVEAYSKDMLDNLANNPEMAAYVLGSLEADGSVTGGFTEAELEEEFPLLLQYDPRWGYFEYGGKEMGLSGCGPTCLAMTVLALTDLEDVTPDKVAAYSTEHGYYVKDVGTVWKLLDEFPTLYGLFVEHPALTEESMKKALDEGKVLICSVKKGVFTAQGHFIMVYGYDENGFLINDPKCVARSRQAWNYAEFGSQIKRIWAVGSKNQ